MGTAFGRPGNVAGWEEQASKQRGGDAKSSETSVLLSPPPRDPTALCLARILEMVCSQCCCQKKSVFFSHVCGMLFFFVIY